MVIEGAANAIKGAATFVANKAPESAGRAAGVAVNTAEKAVGAAKDVLHNGADKLRGASAQFRESFANARTPKDAEGAVNGLADGQIPATDSAPHTDNLVDVATGPTKSGTDALDADTDKSKKPLGADETKDQSGEQLEKVRESEKKDMTQERFDNNFKNELARAQSSAAQELQQNHPDLNITMGPDGLPTDPKFTKEYAEIYAKHSEVARNEAVHTTITQDFMDDNPVPDKDKDPIGYDKYMQEMNHAHQEFEEAKKNLEKPQESAKPETQSIDGETSEVPEAKEKEDNSASFTNAFKLATALENAENDEARKTIQDKIDSIHSKNETVKPRFKSRVTIAKVLIIGKSIALMGAMGVATSAAERAVTVATN